MTYNVGLGSGVLPSVSVIHIHVSILFQILLITRIRHKNHQKHPVPIS